MFKLLNISYKGKMKSTYMKAFILSILASFAIVINNGTCKVSELRKAFQSPSYMVLLLTILVFVALVYLIPKVKKENIKWGIPFSIIVSIMMLLCESYYKCGSWDNVFGSGVALLTSILKGIGIAILIFFVFDLISKVNIEENSNYSPKKFTIKSFIKLVAIMFLCWIPYMIILAPGSMNPDTRDQIGQVLGREELCWSSQTTIREEGETLLNNHHPVFHTLIIGVFVKLGKLIGSYFISMELYCIIQCLILVSVLTYLVIKLRQFGMSKKLSRIVYGFFAFCPIFPTYGMSLLKDIPFTIALVMITILLYELFKYPQKFSTKKYCGLFGFSLLLMLMRNNGFYMLLLLLPCILIYFRKNKKVLLKVVITLGSALVLYKVVYMGIIFSSFGIRNGSVREMLSVPFQQTARYVKEHKDEITKEEEDTILKILGNEKTTLDDIGKRYVPGKSDKVKNMYNKYATKDDLKNYIKVWGKMFCKHPTTYIEAFFNLNYGWFWFDNPHDNNIYYNGIIDDKIPEYIDGLSNPQELNRARSLLYDIIKILDSIPIISCLFEFSFYTYAYAISLIVMIKRRKYEILLATIPIFINYLICFIGPVAYMRYAIPMVACIPMVVFLTFSNKKEIENMEEDEIWIK